MGDEGKDEEEKIGTGVEGSFLTEGRCRETARDGRVGCGSKTLGCRCLR